MGVGLSVSLKCPQLISEGLRWLLKALSRPQTLFVPIGPLVWLMVSSVDLVVPSVSLQGLQLISENPLLNSWVLF